MWMPWGRHMILEICLNVLVELKLFVFFVVFFNI